MSLVPATALQESLYDVTMACLRELGFAAELMPGTTLSDPRQRAEQRELLLFYLVRLLRDLEADPTAVGQEWRRQEEGVSA